MLLFSAFVFALGLIVGSFLNAVIYRLALAEGSVPEIRDRAIRVPVSPFRGRSFCPQCKHQLSWYDLIPVVSFLLLRGKCRYCRKRISLQYPIVELSTATLFLLIFKLQGSSFNQTISAETLNLFYLWTIASLLVVLFVYDLRHYILPDKILFPAILVSGIWYLVSSIFFQSYTVYEILYTIYSALAAALFFFAIFALSRGKAMGFGDVKLALFMGLFLGFPQILVALFLAFLLGAIIGVGLIVLQKKKMKSEIPFGPFLIAGTFAALLWGERIIHWYWNLVLV